MRQRVPLLVVMIGWLAAAATVGAGCGNLRGSLNDGGHGAGGGGHSGGRGGAGGFVLNGGAGGSSAVGGQGGAGGTGGTVAVGGAGGHGTVDAGVGGTTGGAGGRASTGGGAGTSGPDAAIDAPLDAAKDVADAAVMDAVAGPDTSGAVNGLTCASNAACNSGHCVDGKCCNDACTGQCEACDVPSSVGTCVPVTGDVHLANGRIACGSDGSSCGGKCDGVNRTACKYSVGSCRLQTCAGMTKIKAAVCDGMGACPAMQTMPCSMGCSGNDCSGSCADDGACMMASAMTPYCDLGLCTAKKPYGRTCTAATECTSGKCVDGYCCDTDCATQCGSCKEAGSLGRCITVSGPPVAPRTACAGNGVCQGKCNGVAPTCVLPTSSTMCGSAGCASGMATPVGGCSAGSCVQQPNTCPSGYCSPTTLACAACVNDTDCGMGKWCNAGTCQAKLANGAACSVGADNQCQLGHCVAGASGASVCCASACSGATPSCNAAGTACTCTCINGQVCDATKGGMCCSPNACSACLTGLCVRGCGLPDAQPNCGQTGSGCCGTGASSNCCANYGVCCAGTNVCLPMNSMCG